MPSSCAASTSSAAPSAACRTKPVLDLVRAAGLPVSAMGVEYGWIFSTGAERERLLGVFRECLRERRRARLRHDDERDRSGRGVDRRGGRQHPPRRRDRRQLRPAAHARIPVPASGGAQPRHPARADRARRLEQCRPAARRLSPAARRAAGAGLRGRARRGDLLRPVQRRARRTAAGLPPVDRLPPGQGVVDWTGLFGLLAEKGYDGWLSYEAPNPAHWQQPAAETAKQGAEAARRALAGAVTASGTDGRCSPSP